jgi:hypothetical protein
MASSDNIKAEVVTDSASFARKRRIELRSMQRSGKTGDDLDEGSNVQKKARMEEPQVDPVTSKLNPSITGIKKMHRYDPGVNMSRDELKAWRKEARRVRNRESAAASRKRNRERIDELESEVDVLQYKYSAALQRIIDLEASSAVNDDSFTPAVLRQDLYDLSTNGRRPASPVTEPIKTVSPPMSPFISSRRVSDVDEHLEEVNTKYYHIMEMISRPAASARFINLLGERNLLSPLKPTSSSEDLW